MAKEEDKTQAIIKYTRTMTVFVGIICVIISGIVLIEMKTVIVPLVIAIVINFLLNPIIVFFEKKHIPKLISILFVLTVTFFVLFIVGRLVNQSIQSFTANIEQYEARFQTIMDDIIAIFGWIGSSVKGNDINGKFQDFTAILDNISIKNIVSTILGSISSIFSDMFLVLLYLLFFLIGRNRLLNKFDIAFSSEVSEQMKTIVKRINEQINKYVLTKSLLSFLTGTLVTVTLWLFGVEFAFIWGLLTFLLNFIPNIGSIIATIFPIIFSIIQFDNFMVVIWIAVILLAIQFLVGNVLEPRIVGQSMDISPIVVLFSLIFWGYVWGVIGMVLAMPFAVFIKIILENISGLKPFGILLSDYK